MSCSVPAPEPTSNTWAFSSFCCGDESLDPSADVRQARSLSGDSLVPRAPGIERLVVDLLLLRRGLKANGFGRLRPPRKVVPNDGHIYDQVSKRHTLDRRESQNAHCPKLTSGTVDD